MAWLIWIIVATLVWNDLVDAHRLRAMRHLLRSYDPATPAPESPSPHQLLGDIARPLARPTRRHHRLIR